MMNLIVKVGDIVIYNLLRDYRLSVIETEYEVPNNQKRDNFENPTPGVKQATYKLKLKGYEPNNGVTIFSSLDKTDVKKFQEEFYKQVQTVLNNPKIYTMNEFFMNFDELTKGNI